MDLSFISAKDNSTGGIKSKNISRHQFVEIIVRIAEDRFLRTNLTDNLAEAVERIIKEYFIPTFEENNIQKWKTTRFFNMHCEKVIKKYWSILQIIYKKYAGSVKNTLSLNKKMWLQDFKQIWIDAELVDDYFTERDMNLAFVLCVCLEPDEFIQEKHLKLNFYEFIESIAKVSEKLSLIPIGITDVII